MDHFQARLFDELTPIYPDTDVGTGLPSYTVAGANGSYAGVQIAVSGLTPGLPLSFEIKGPHRAYKLFQLLPIPVEVNTGAVQRSEYLKDDYNENVIRRAPFYVYEALEPIFNLALPTVPNAAFVFPTPIEYCRQTEEKNWTILLRHNGAEQELHLTVEQYPVSIPKAGRDTYQFVNWVNFENIAEWHNAPKWSPKYESMLEKYLRAAVYTRQNILTIPPSEVYELDESGEPVLNAAHMETMVRIAHKAGIFLFVGGAFCTRAASLQDDDDFYNSLDHEHFTTPEQINEAFKWRAFEEFDYGTEAKLSLTGELLSTEKGQAQLRSMLRQLNTWLEGHGLKEDWTQCCLDEPNDALCDTYHIISKITREELPGVPILEPVLPTEKVVGDLDIWCPSLHIYEQNRDFFEKRVEEGDRLYVYACLTPGGNYCNRLLDMERLRVVYLSWAPVLYPHVEGFLHWGLNATCHNNPFQRQAAMFSEQVLEYHPKYANFLPAGDECIFYPGFNEPLISTRSEAHRIGFEDLYLLQQIQAVDAPRAEAIVKTIFRGYAEYSKSVSEYRAAKKALLEAAKELLTEN